MKLPQRSILALFVIAVSCVGAVHAGMPAPLSTPRTKEHPPDWATSSVFYGSTDARWQAISFFMVCLLLSAWAVKLLWMSLRKSLTWLPVLDYRRSLTLIILWGLLFVIVLTMISGARELMTPSAWRKQGWTYKLSDSPVSARDNADAKEQRRRGLEQLRTAMWQYAAKHHGQFPEKDDPSLDAKLWVLPGWPGLQFLSVGNRVANEAGQLLVFEPEADGDERQVLLTNGMIGTMRTTEIQQTLASEKQP